MNLLEEIENFRMIKLSESNQYIVREALEAYRNEKTDDLHFERDPNRAEYIDIEILEIDEILELIGDE